MLKEILKITELGIVPDRFVRYGIRQLCKKRLHEIKRDDLESLMSQSKELIYQSSHTVIAKETDKANAQHYELPTDFFKLVLGENLKYSCSLYPDKKSSLSGAESSTLELYVKRAQLKDGQSILDLGCGWGSMTLFIANKFPSSKITAVSNSKSQKDYIDAEAKLRKLDNIQVITCDINNLTFAEKFDRIISVEMLEHVSNHQILFEKIASWTKPEGLIFIHIFCHLLAAYPFIINDESDWMAKNFFTGGIMPAYNQFLYYQNSLLIKNNWMLNGTHYENTANAWLINLDKNKEEIALIFKKTYGNDHKKWLQRWRIFFMACAELFGYNNGTEWVVGHYLFAPR